MSAAGARAPLCPRTGLEPISPLESELQPKLYRAVASRTDDWIAGGEVGRLTPAAERRGGRGIIAVMRAIVCAVGIGDGGAIEDVKYLEAELGSEALLEREVLEYGEIPIPEAIVAEDVPAHGAKGSSLGRSHNRVACYVAAARSQRREIRGRRRTLRAHCCRIREGEAAAVNPGLRRAFNSSSETSAVGNGIRSGLEVQRVPEKIPPILVLRSPAEIVAGVGDVPGLGALNAHDGVDLPAFQ